MKKSTVKMGQEGAKARAQLKTLSMPMPPNSTGFLPKLRYKHNRVVSQQQHIWSSTQILMSERRR